jgi:hypothetical protein
MHHEERIAPKHEEREARTHQHRWEAAEGRDRRDADRERTDAGDAADELVDLASALSFPASDPPSLNQPA